MSPALPHTGGAYSFGRTTMGPWGGFITGLAENMEYVLTPAVIVVGIGGYLGAICNDLFGLQLPAPAWWAISYGIFVGLNILGVEATFKFTVVITFLALGILAVFWIGALPHFSADLLFTVKPGEGGTRFLPHGIGGIFANGFIGSIIGAIFGLLMVIAGYYIWSYLTFYIGTKFFGGEADVGEVLRTFGYSYSPQVLGILAFIPCIGWGIALVAGIWSLVAGVVAIREAMDFDTGKAILTAAIAWVIMTVLFMIIGMVVGIGGMGMGAIFGR
jgi:hypothetical protein